MTPHLAMVHVHDARVRWIVPASQVVRILAASEWVDSPPIDVLATLGPEPPPGLHGRRVVVVSGANDRQTALLATGAIAISDVDPSTILPLPDTIAATVPEVSAIVVAHDASLSLLFNPSAVTRSPSPDDSAPREEPCLSP
jgi:chemotaxis signal transduction protein